MSGTRMNTKPVPVMASTPASPSRNFISHLNEQSASLESGEGDYSYAMNTPGTAVDEPDCSKTRTRPRNLSWKRVKDSISRSLSHVDLFSRGSARKTVTMCKTGSKKNGDLETIFQAGNEPKLLAAYKAPTTPTIDLPSSRPLEEVDYSYSRHNQTYGGGQHNMNTIYRASKTKLRSLGGIENATSSSTLVRRGHSSRSQLNTSMSGLKKPITQEPVSSRSGEPRQEHQELLGENNKLREENQELWEDNRMLTATFEDAQTRLKYLQERNKYLELAMYQEGKVLTDIIKECHNEIATLKATQCELLGQENYEESSSKNVEKCVREYYISKYANEDDSLFYNQNQHVVVPSPGRKMTEFFETLPESTTDTD